jgi:hypothetical protein
MQETKEKVKKRNAKGSKESKHRPYSTAQNAMQTKKRKANCKDGETKLPRSI